MPFDATPTNTEADVLRRAKALIDAPEKWCQMFAARTKNNKWFGFHEALSAPRDAARCVLSAIFYANGSDSDDRAATLWHFAYMAAGGMSAGDFNDQNGTTHADIMALMDRAIALAEAGEP